MDFIEEQTKGTSYHTFKYGVESVSVPRIDYDDDERVVEKGRPPETVATKEQCIDLSPRLKEKQGSPIFSYFLDGSRHTYKVDDIAYGTKVFPVIAGQVSVGCCHRVDKKMQPFKLSHKNVIVLPKECHPDGRAINARLNSWKDKLNEELEKGKLNIIFDDFLYYKTSEAEGNFKKLDDLGIARIQDYMIEAEKQMVVDLATAKKLNQHNYLVKDGSLEYRETGNDKDKISLKKSRNNYNYVVGVSKQFNPENCLDKNGKRNATVIARMPLYSRTPVIRTSNERSGKDIEFAVWYIRLREPKYTRSPFDGVIKVEKIIMPHEFEQGLNSETVNTLSVNLINERNPTCYGSDTRWGNHLYPVYLTESFVKSKFISTDVFLNLF